MFNSLKSQVHMLLQSGRKGKQSPVIPETVREETGDPRDSLASRQIKNGETQINPN